MGLLSWSTTKRLTISPSCGSPSVKGVLTDSFQAVRQAATAPVGKLYQECYDVEKALPTAAHLDMFNKVKEDLHAMGIAFPY